MWSPEARVRGCLGFVIFIPPGRDRDFPRGRFLYSYLEVGEDVIARFEPRATHIGQLELLAAIMVYTTVPSLVAGQFVLHFIDNTSALAGLIAGSSRSWDSARLIHTFQVVNVSVRAKPWFSYVASKANVSDFPSRRDFAAMAATIRAVHDDFCITRDFVAPVQPAVHKSWAELAAAMFPPRKRKRVHRGAR